LAVMHSLGKRAKPVQFRMGAPIWWPLTQRSRASAQASLIRPPCPGQHWGLRVLAHGHLAFLQQSADLRCKEVPPGQHRQGAPIQIAPVAQLPECSRRKAEVAGRSPARRTIVPVAQCTGARPCEGRGRRRDSCREHQFPGRVV